MKIVYTRPDGGISVVSPAEGARLANSVTLANGTVLSGGPRSVDQFLRRWPVAGAVAQWAETEDEFLARVRARSVPANASGVRIVNDTDIPTDRTFRNAWQDPGSGAVKVDMPKACEIHRARLRELRTPMLAALDVEWMKALETGDEQKKTQVAAKKQALRDVTADPAIDAADTPAALKAVLPTGLT